MAMTKKQREILKKYEKESEDNMIYLDTDGFLYIGIKDDESEAYYKVDGSGNIEKIKRMG